MDRTDTKLLYSKITTRCIEYASIDQSDFCMNHFISSGIEFNLSCVHLPSKLYDDDETRCGCARKILRDIEVYESEHGKNTLVIGDFNADPHESTLLSTSGFHALPDKSVAVDERTVRGSKYSSFYNPMWNLYGDMIKPTGTHYYDNSSAKNQYWYLLDQVIMRHGMLRYYNEGSLKIVQDGFQKSNGKPGKSDHFPIFFSLE